MIALNVRSYHEQTRTAILRAIRRIVTAECAASGSPQPPEFELFDRFPVTENDGDVTEKVAAAFSRQFGEHAQELPLQMASEDFSDIPNALGIPYTYGGIGGIDPETYERARAAGRIARDIPVNLSATFVPVLQPTLDTGTRASSSPHSPGSAARRLQRPLRRWAERIHFRGTAFTTRKSGGGSCNLSSIT